MIEKIVRKMKRNPSLLHLFVVTVLLYASNTRCAWIGHQPQMPEEVRKFKRL